MYSQDQIETSPHSQDGHHADPLETFVLKRVSHQHKCRYRSPFSPTNLGVMVGTEIIVKRPEERPAPNETSTECQRSRYHGQLSWRIFSSLQWTRCRKSRAWSRTADIDIHYVARTDNSIVNNSYSPCSNDNINIRQEYQDNYFCQSIL